MNLHDFDLWARSFLKIDELIGKDDSLNGIQVAKSATDIRKVAFAVDACQESFRRAKSLSADLLFVHHGLFWGAPERIEGPLLERLRLLIDSDMALYACHLPLDMHPVVGNNAVLADRLGLVERKPFGSYHGLAVGVSGTLEASLSIDGVIAKILPDGSRPRGVIAAGKSGIRTVAIVSGGAPFEALQALGGEIDLFLTGEPSHSIYHQMVEGEMNFIAAGHYATEVWGVQAVAAKLFAEKGVETTFIDVPTGL